MNTICFVASTSTVNTASIVPLYAAVTVSFRLSYLVSPEAIPLNFTLSPSLAVAVELASLAVVIASLIALILAADTAMSDFSDLFQTTVCAAKDFVSICLKVTVSLAGAEEPPTLE